MKTKLIGITLFGLTAAAIVAYPGWTTTTVSQQPPAVIHPPMLANERPRIEVVFVLDTTGSMSGLIETAKEKIWSIASSMASAQPTPEIRMGLVAYRDRGDDYVTRVVDLSEDLDSVYASLIDLDANGGGDDPESVNQALYDAVHSVSWSQDPKSYKVVFLVGDAPAHMDYQGDVKYPDTIVAARAKGIVINTIQCGQLAETRIEWNTIAELAAGDFFQVEQAGGAVAISTPFDATLASLSAELDRTRLYYGSEEEKRKKLGKLEATEKLHTSASSESQARRAAFNASEAGKSNLLGEGDLVEDLASGRVELTDIEPAELPAAMQAMSAVERDQAVEETAKKRDQLGRQIRALAEQREAFIQEKLAKEGGAEDSFDHKLYDVIKAQAESIGGLRYDEAPKY